MHRAYHSASGLQLEELCAATIIIINNLPTRNPPLLPQFSTLTFILMNFQPSNERKHQPSSSLPSRTRSNTKQRVANWFAGQHSFFRFKLKSSGFLSHSRSSSSSSSSSKSQHSSESISSDPSFSRSQSPSTSISKDSIYYASTTRASNQAGKKMGQTLDAMSSSKFATHSRRPPIQATAPQTRTTSNSSYREPIANFFATIPAVPGVCFIFSVH